MEINTGKVVQRDPTFIIYTGPMAGGKTSKMLSALDRATYQQKTIAVFKPRMDRRYSDDDIVTHTGHHWEATLVSSGKEIFELANGADIVAVDEAFMIDGVADALIALFRNGKSIHVASIQLSARGEPFEEVQQMFPWATRVEVCPAVCPITGRDAYYTVATKEGLDDIEVGGMELYSPRCHQHTSFMQD